MSRRSGTMAALGLLRGRFLCRRCGDGWGEALLRGKAWVLAPPVLLVIPAKVGQARGASHGDWLCVAERLRTTSSPLRGEGWGIATFMVVRGQPCLTVSFFSRH